MFIPVEKSDNPQTNYERLLETLPFYINDSDPWYTTLANASSVLDYFLDDINWVGFYVMHGEDLFLGPFQGKAACTKILMGSGVCGHAAIKKETVRIDDVEQFDGHITCDADSKSELVIPLVKKGKLIGVLDIDAPIKGRFKKVDQDYLEKVVQVIVDNLK